jgi:hypothetical protein
MDSANHVVRTDPQKPAGPNAPCHLRCHYCGRTTQMSQAELLECAHLSWPRCCRLLMTLQFIETEMPASPQTN